MGVSAPAPPPSSPAPCRGTLPASGVLLCPAVWWVLVRPPRSVHNYINSRGNVKSRGSREPVQGPFLGPVSLGLRPQTPWDVCTFLASPRKVPKRRREKGDTPFSNPRVCQGCIQFNSGARKMHTLAPQHPLPLPGRISWIGRVHKERLARGSAENLMQGADLRAECRRIATVALRKAACGPQCPYRPFSPVPSAGLSPGDTSNKGATAPLVFGRFKGVVLRRGGNRNPPA